MHAAADDGVAGLRRRRKPHGVGQLAPKVQTADEREHVAERRAAARPQRNGESELRLGDSTCFARVPPQLAGDSRNTLACGDTTDDTAATC